MKIDKTDKLAKAREKERKKLHVSKETVDELDGLADKIIDDFFGELSGLSKKLSSREQIERYYLVLKEAHYPPITGHYLIASLFLSIGLAGYRHALLNSFGGICPPAVEKAGGDIERDLFRIMRGCSNKCANQLHSFMKAVTEEVIDEIKEHG